MKFLFKKMHYFIVFCVMIAAVFAKNTVSYPLGQDFSYSYGVPLAIWEQCSLEGKVAVKLVSHEYKSSAFPFTTNCVLLDLFIDLALNFFLCGYLLRKCGESKVVCHVRILSFFLILYLLCLLSLSILVEWSNDFYRVFYINIVFLYFILSVLSVVKIFLSLIANKRMIEK